jgi:hypothetical protein
MQAYARLIKLKPGSDTAVAQWAQTMNARKNEALATLVDEGVAVESWFSLELGGEQYLICYMRAESMEKAQNTLTQSMHPIDAVHQQFKIDTWVRGAGAEGRLLLDLQVDE